MALSKRAWLAVWASRLGVLRALEGLARRRCLIVLNYHRVTVPESCPYDRGVIEATPEQFDEQMGWIRQRFHMADLDEVYDVVVDPGRLRHSSVLVSFDDGYRDNVDVALPILKSHGLRAAFFLPTAFIGTTRVAWWDQIAYVIRHTTRRQVVLKLPERIQFDVSEVGVETVIRAILSVYKKRRGLDTSHFLLALQEACGVDLPLTASDRLFMSWEEAAALMRAGMALGSHSHSHEILAASPRDQQLVECLTSRIELQHNLGMTPVAFAYPVGSMDSFSVATQECLRESGYKLGFSYYGGVNTAKAIQALDIKRITLDRDETLDEYRLRTALAGATVSQVW